ncbi:MAG: hypothetical protein B6244_04655 [Candidatus Cloacimonetes bacterium 4572_55]|nr:MAG: hypothetical protein B6244_04655 [Candidatus Cloacimonetes bacterium 4572_55]
MIETKFRQTIQRCSTLVDIVEYYEISEEAGIARLKAKLQLYDGSFLWIREIRVHDTLDNYSYYWLRQDNSVIIGWDSAPHHKHISSFPHHKHVGNRIQPSSEKNLDDVLQAIASIITR